MPRCAVTHGPLLRVQKPETCEVSKVNKHMMWRGIETINMELHRNSN